MTSRLPQRSMLALAGAILAVAPMARAAVSTGEQLDPAPTHQTPSLSGVPQDKTVELLLQLQDQQRSPADSPRRANSAPAQMPPVGLPPPRSADAEAAPNLREALIGEAARMLSESPSGAQSSSARGGSVNDRPSYHAATEAVAGFGAQATPTLSRAAVADTAPPSILSNPVIRFVRDHRELSLGAAVGVLVAVWLATNFRSRNRRR